MRSLSTSTTLCCFWKKLLLLVGFAVSKCAVFIGILGFQWLMQVHQFKYLPDYRRPFSSFKADKT